MRALGAIISTTLIVIAGIALGATAGTMLSGLAVFLMLYLYARANNR